MDQRRDRRGPPLDKRQATLPPLESPGAEAARDRGVDTRPFPGRRLRLNATEAESDGRAFG